MLVLRASAPPHDRWAHFARAGSYRPLCNARLGAPEGWQLVPIRLGAVRICTRCWKLRFDGARVL